MCLPLHPLRIIGRKKSTKDLWKFGNNSNCILEKIQVKVIASTRIISDVNFDLLRLIVRSNNIYNGEFDPGSGWTLAASLIHASRGAAWSSNTLMATGKRVRNTYTTFLLVGNSPEKFGLIPRNITMWHHIVIIASALDDGCAYD